MKTVTGRVISEEPISLSKAATLLSRFVSSDNGASQAVSAYLRRTSAAFTELNSIHKQNKSSSLKEMKSSSDAEHDGKLTCESDDFGRADDIGVGNHFGNEQKRESNGIDDLVEKEGKIAFRKSETVRGKESVYGREERREEPKEEEEDAINEGKTKNKKKKKKKSRKNKEEDDVDGKVTQKSEDGDKAMEMEMEMEDEQRKDESKERKKKKKKKRKSDEEIGSEEKRSKKKSKLNEIDG